MQTVKNPNTSTVDPHSKWRMRHDDLTRRLAMLPDRASDAIDELWSARTEMEEKIADTPAETMLAVVEQIKLALRIHDECHDLSDVSERALRNAVAALERPARS